MLLELDGVGPGGKFNKAEEVVAVAGAGNDNAELDRDGDGMEPDDEFD